MVNLIKSISICIILLYSPIVTAGEIVDMKGTVLCDSRESMQKSLNALGEQIVLVGVFADKKHLLHLFVNKEAGEWSIVSLNTDEVYCLLFFGDGLTLYRKTGRQHAETY